MTEGPASEISTLLRRAREDRESALRELFPLVHAELRRLAGAQMRRERRDHTLEPTALVNEAYARLAGEARLEWQDRAQFLTLAARAMRQVLVDHARARNARKRGGDVARVTLNEELLEGGGRGVDVLDLHEKLEELAALNERPARVVELRFFGGLTFEESGHVLGVSGKTVEADWYFARAWLRREMRAQDSDDPSVPS
jgi:RNA polymerase sigma-70 factor (ECF subfamily)